MPSRVAVAGGTGPTAAAGPAAAATTHVANAAATKAERKGRRAPAEPGSGVPAPRDGPVRFEAGRGTGPR